MNRHKLLNSALPQVYCDCLTFINWNSYKEQYHATISKLEAMESLIKEEVAKGKTLRDLADNFNVKVNQSNKR